MDDWRLRGQEAWLQNESLYKIDFPAFWLRSYAEKNAFYRKIAEEARRFVAQMGRGQEHLEGDKIRHFWHEHCEFCWEKVTCDTDASFYCTGDLRYWVCPSCFRDFKDKFGWTEKDASVFFDSNPRKRNKTMNIETVKTDTFTMDYLRFGRGKDPLVILPGLSVQSVMGLGDLIAEAYQVLTEDFTIYLFDRRKDLPAVYPIREMARDTAEALRALGLSNVALFGASQGGMIAMALAAEHPELVSRLVPGSSAARVDGEHCRLFEDWIDLAKAGKARELNLAFGEALYPKAVFEGARDLLLSQADTFTPADLRRFVILAESLRNFDVREDLARIACPVLVLGAEDDQVLGAEASRELFRHLPKRPNSALYLYAPGFGHAAFDTAPDYKERLLRFLRKETAAE